MPVDLRNLIWLPNEGEELARLPHYTCPDPDNGRDNGRVHSWCDWFRNRAVPAIPWLDGERDGEARRVLLLIVPRDTPMPATGPKPRTPDNNWHASFEARGLHSVNYLSFAVWKKDYEVVSGTDWPHI